MNSYQYQPPNASQQAGTDFFSLANPQGPVGFQDALPPIQFEWVPEKSDKRSRVARVTINSLRGGLGLQRDDLGRALQRLSTSSLVTHANDEVILPFETVTQTNLSNIFAHNTMLSGVYADRVFLAPYLNNGIEPRLFAETSFSDPTVMVPVNGIGVMYSMGPVRFAGTEYLGICTQSSLYLMQITPGNVISNIYGIVFNVTTSASVPTPSVNYNYLVVAGGTYGGTNSAILSYQYGGGQHQVAGVTQSYIGTSFIQSPLPGNPLIVRAGSDILLARTDVFTGKASLILRNAGLGNAQPIGMQTVGGRPARAYWLESNTGSPISAGNLVTRIASTNAYGADYQVLNLSTERILGAVKIRDGIAVCEGKRVVFFNGREHDLGLFRNQKPDTAYTEFCIGLGVKDHQLYAEINELPQYVSNVGYGVGVARGTVRRCLRRYDFEIGTWSQVSDWTTFTADGLINWATGVPIPVASGSVVGYMSAFGAPSLPIGPVTQAFHGHAAPARYAPDLLTTVALPSTPRVTWFHQFIENAGTSPYSLRGSQAFADSGVARTPGLLFPGEALYAPKTILGYQWGGEATGGSDATVTIRAGEYDTLDTVDSAGNKRLLTHEFEAGGIDPVSRIRDFPDNQTRISVPQIEIEIQRGSVSEVLTPQALPLTVEFAVHFRERRSIFTRWMWWR